MLPTALSLAEIGVFIQTSLMLSTGFGDPFQRLAPPTPVVIRLVRCEKTSFSIFAGSSREFIVI
jgi:hypothetical protein